MLSENVEDKSEQFSAVNFTIFSCKFYILVVYFGIELGNLADSEVYYY